MKILKYFVMICLLWQINLHVFGANTEQNNPIADISPHIIEGKITSTQLDTYENSPDGDRQRKQLFSVKLAKTQETVDVLHITPDSIPYKLNFKNGDSIMLHQEGEIYNIDGYKISTIAYILIGVFLALLWLIGGRKGILAVISLLIKGSLLIFGVIPLLKMGISPIMIASIFCVMATLLTMVFVSGLNLKTVSATLGTMTGVVVAGIVGMWAVYHTHYTGLYEVETQTLYAQYPYINISEMAVASVLIGSLGAAMDVAISIASSLSEIHEIAPNMTMKELYTSGMNIGRDIMGTMVNTLILAYAGSSLVSIILMSMIDPSILLNTEMLMKEIILAFVGSIGMILTIPLTAIISSWLYTRKKTPINLDVDIES